MFCGNILFLVHSLKGGGAERMVSRLANGFAVRGYNVSIGLFDISEFAYEINEDVEIVNFDSDVSNKIKKGIKRIIAIHRYLKNNQTDVIFAFMVSMVPYAIISKIKNTKVIGAERANPKNLKQKYKILLRIFSPFCDGYIFQTQGAKRCYPLVTQKKSIVIGNIAPYVQKEKNAKIKNSICSVGRLSEDKDFSSLLKAFQLVLNVLPDTTLYIYGQGEKKQELIALAEKLSIESHVYWKGFEKNIINEIQKHSVFAFASKTEGMPNALLEAMAAGMPCVSTDCDFGPADLIIDGENGFLVPVGDAEKMAQRIIELLKNNSLRNKMGNDAREIIKEYSEDKILQSYTEYVERIMRN
ncbi:MAG: glycosyltransferase family 4 protein [Acetivibrio ethanolgignens]